jgi:CBS domain-containing protein
MESHLAPSSFSAETPVRYAMSRGVIALPHDATIGACALAMRDRRTHAVLIVTSAKTPLGWVFDHDLLRYMPGDPLTTLASEAVSEAAQYIDSEAAVREAAERMIEERVTHLLVGRSPDSMPEGVLSTWDLVSFYAVAAGQSL